MSLANQHSGPTLNPSERDWLEVREYLQRNRYELGQAVAAEYPGTLKVNDTPLLSRPPWLPVNPLPLDAVDLEFRPDEPFTGLTGTEPITEGVRPDRSGDSRYPTYSAAMAELAAPAVFENRSTYRLLDADLSGERGRLVFGRGAYFDGINVGESVAHEYAAAQLHGSGNPLRDAIGNPCDPARRPTNIAISMLTIRHDRVTGEASFLLHRRDPAKVGHAGGLYMVIPVGIFQASDDHPTNEHNDFSLWNCMIREYAEELLGAPEDYGTPIDYDAWPFANRMTAGVHHGEISAQILGLGADPLTLATDLLTAVVFDAPVFDELFTELVHNNAEGSLVGTAPGKATSGFPFTRSEIEQLSTQPIQAAGAAALRLAYDRRVTDRPT